MVTLRNNFEEGEEWEQRGESEREQKGTTP